MGIATIVCGVIFVIVFGMQLFKILIGNPIDPIIALFVTICWVMTAFCLGFAEGYVR